MVSRVAKKYRRVAFAMPLCLASAGLALADTITVTNTIPVATSFIPNPVPGGPPGTVFTSYGPLSRFQTGTFNVGTSGTFSGTLSLPGTLNTLYILTGTFAPNAVVTPTTPLVNFKIGQQNINTTTINNIVLTAGTVYSFLLAFGPPDGPTTFTFTLSGAGCVVLGTTLCAAPLGPPPPTLDPTIALTPNQKSVVTAINALGAGNALILALINLTPDQQRGAFDQLSGEIHASIGVAQFNDAYSLQNSVLGHLWQGQAFGFGLFGTPETTQSIKTTQNPGKARPKATLADPAYDSYRFNVWGEGSGNWGRTRGDGNAAHADRSSGGFLFGADAGVDLFGQPTRLGIAGGYRNTSLDVDGRVSSATVESFAGSLYGATSFGKLNLRLGSSYAWHNIDTTRTIALAGLAGVNSASYDGYTVQGFGEIGYRFDFGPSVLEPFIGASLIRLHRDGFHETGTTTALNGLGRDQDLGTTTIGVHAATKLAFDGRLTLQGTLAWQHAFGEVQTKVLESFQASASPFPVQGVPIQRDSLVLNLGVDWAFSDRVTASASYGGLLGKDAQDHTLKGRLAVKF